MLVAINIYKTEFKAKDTLQTPEKTPLQNIHVQGLLSLGSFILGAVAYYSVALCQVEVECDEGAVLHAQCT